MGIVTITSTTQLYKYGIYCIYQPTFKEFFISPYSLAQPLVTFAGELPPFQRQRDQLRE